MDESKKQALDDLVARFMGGDSDLLRFLMATLGRPVQSFFVALGIPAGEAPFLAEDFFEDLFERKIWRYKPREGSSFWSWLCVVISNAAKDWHKKRANNPEVPSSDYIDTVVSVSTAHTTLEAQLSPRMVPIVAALQDALMKLHESDRDLLRLKEVAGLDYAEIATIFDDTLDANGRKRLANRLKTQAHRAREKVREFMSSDSRVPTEFFELAHKEE
jgi:RNA polymerase sigma factor (sigma-70 family)